ncbi:hypothetical protein NDU88_002609 [Pleurodeles waltl]|uniref:Uncharacterized protein n=1 Tax=Pleurodeles waltl TaxID=8319 RepID=A0AAV7UW41_PLEWA|nr:hypothetical protein NDU88_002609 [Pleurodeles waltl]
MQPRSVESRRAGCPERSSAVVTAPTRVTGCVHSHCSGAIPATGTFLVSGAPRPPVGLSGAAPSARGPQEELAPESRPTAADVGTAGRQHLLGARGDPGVAERITASATG